MYASYGGFQHPDNEVNIVRVEHRARFSPRNKRLTTIRTIYLEGEILADTQSALDAAVAAREDAYKYDGNDFGFYTDAGALTRHRLIQNDPYNLSGVRVINQSWPKGDAAEFATKRTFSVTLQAEIITADSQIVEWQETVEYVGNCGPRYEIVETYLGPVSQLLCKRTSQKIIQSGSALGFQGYILPPGPLLPSIEHQDLRRSALVSGKVMGRVALFYPSSWTYIHTSDRYREVAPVTR